MAKPIITIDIDDVISPFMHVYADYLRETNAGATITFGKGMTYVLHEQLGWSIERASEALDIFFESDKYAELRPVDGALEAIRTIQQKYQVVLLTARHEDHRVITEQWFSRHFPDVFDNIHFVGFAATQPGAVYTKRTVVEELGAVGLVDDNLKTITDIAAGGHVAILFGDYDWNHTDELPKGVRRANTWSDVVEMLGC